MREFLASPEGLETFLSTPILLQVPKAGYSETHPIGSFPWQTGVEFTRHGAQRKANDACGGSDLAKGSDALKEALESILDKIFSGDWSEKRGGGGVLTPEEKETRAVIMESLTHKDGMKMKVADAEPLSRDRAKAVAAMAEFKVARDGGELEAAVESIDKAISASVKRALAAKAKPLF
jgi:hypothetical protein